MSTPELKPETPITDAEAYNCTREDDWRDDEIVVPVEVCRKLESALNAAREAIETELKFAEFEQRQRLRAALAQIDTQQSKTT